jgi:hypothetical protein
MWIRDPGWKNSDPGSGMGKIQIRDKHPGSATLIYTKYLLILGIVKLIFSRWLQKDGFFYSLSDRDVSKIVLFLFPVGIGD